MTLYFTNDHEWLKVEGEFVTIGITNHAQSQLGDIVFIELPEVGKTVDIGQSIAVVESVKAASDVYAPVAGEIVEVNSSICDDPARVNSEAEAGGWFIKVKVDGELKSDGFMDAEAYKTFAS